MAQNDEMVGKMARAGIKSVFLGIENASKKNLESAGKGNIVNASRKAVEICHKYDIMVIGGLIFGFPEDDEASIIENYQFLNSVEADSAYCQILTPYPKTEMRQNLINEGLVTNKYNYKKYNGLWANVKTRYLDSDQLQYLFWYHRQVTLGWWNPSEWARSKGRIWTGIWLYAIKPVVKFSIDRAIARDGWKKRYQKELQRLSSMNDFRDLE